MRETRFLPDASIQSSGESSHEAVPPAGRPVVNRTGLNGEFNFTLRWMADAMRNSDDGADDVSIFTAIGEQLGLRLHPAKAPVEVLVIDHVERPDAN